jgi:hypothetical protein
MKRYVSENHELKGGIGIQDNGHGNLKAGMKCIPYWPSDSPAPDRMKVEKWGSGLED